MAAPFWYDHYGFEGYLENVSLTHSKVSGEIAIQSIHVET